MSIWVLIVSLLLFSGCSKNQEFKYDDCVQSDSGRIGKFVEIRETSIFTMKAFVRWKDKPDEIDSTYNAIEIKACT